MLTNHDFSKYAQGHTPVNPVKVENMSFEDSIVELSDSEIIPLKTELPEVEPFHFEILPDDLHDWIKDIHERIQCPPDFLAVTAMVSMAAVIGRKVGIHPKAFDDWLVIPNLWGAIIGRPSAMKSPALSEVLKPLDRLVATAGKRYSELTAEHEANQVLIKAKLEDAEKALKDAAKGKGVLSEQEAMRNYIDIKAVATETPTEKRYKFNDSSVEKLGELLNENTNGLLLVRDELTGWMKSMDREDKSNDRAFFLECFNGQGAYVYDRIMRGTTKIESTTLSIIGGIQPTKFAPYITNAVSMNANDDGFVQRFQLAVYPDDKKDWLNVDRFPNTLAKTKAFELFGRLDVMQPRRFIDDFEQEQIQGLRFSQDAQVVFNGWYESLMKEVKSDDIHPAIESHLMKYSSLIPSLALIIELADNTDAINVSVTSIYKAILWGDYLRSHAMRIYGGIVDPAIYAAKTILKRREKLSHIFKAKDVQQKGWSGLSDYESTKKALAVLVEHCYLIEMVEMTTGRPSTTYRWNKKA